MSMSQMFQTELCECGKLKQVGRACKSCGFVGPEQLAEELEVVAVAKAAPVEDD
jgi:hypothetical protein